MRRLGEYARSHPETIVPRSEVAFDQVAAGLSAYYDVRYSNTVYINKY